MVSNGDTLEPSQLNKILVDLVIDPMENITFY